MSICSQAAPTFELHLDLPAKQHLSVAKALTGFAAVSRFDPLVPASENGSSRRLHTPVMARRVGDVGCSLA